MRPSEVIISTYFYTMGAKDWPKETINVRPELANLPAFDYNVTGIRETHYLTTEKTQRKGVETLKAPSQPPWMLPETPRTAEEALREVQAAFEHYLNEPFHMLRVKYDGDNNVKYVINQKAHDPMTMGFKERALCGARFASAYLYAIHQHVSHDELIKTVDSFFERGLLVDKVLVEKLVSILYNTGADPQYANSIRQKYLQRRLAEALETRHNNRK